MDRCPSCDAPLAEGDWCARCGAPRPAPSTSRLALGAFALSLFPVCLNLAGIGLAIAALTRISARPRALKGRGWAIAALVIAAGWLAVTPLAVVTAPAVRDYLHFRARSNQSEAKAGLKQARRRLEAFRLRTGREAGSLREAGVRLAPPRRYAFFYADEEIQPTEAGPWPRPELPPGSPRPRMIAVGNPDRDDTLDVWVLDASGALTNVVPDLDD
jgi:hypothetical protein